VIKKTLLPNGIRIVTEKMPYVRSVSMGVWVNVGARDESDAQCGLSHFIEHMIFKGTARRSAFQIAKEFDAIGGHSNAFTSMENTCYHARVMDAHLGTMVDILSDIFLNSVFDPIEIERERQVIFQEIGMVEDTPEEYVHLLTGTNFWGDHPLGRSILGSRENILSFDSATIKSFFGKFYHPERIVIAITGNVDHQRIVDLVGQSFESIRCGENLQPRQAPQPKNGVRLHQRTLEQVHVCLAAPGLAVTDPQRFTFSLLNTLLGGNMSSRLFQEIREKRGLAYSVYSFVSSHVDTGMFGVYAGVNAQDVPETIRLTLLAMAQMGRTPASPEELQDAKEYTKGNLLLAAESVDNQMVRLAQNEIHFNQYIPLESVIEAVEAITAEQIRELAQTLFHRDRVSLTLLGPMDTSDGLDEIIGESLM
jgi:predicted Zn-dependent peptidase